MVARNIGAFVGLNALRVAAAAGVLVFAAACVVIGAGYADTYRRNHDS